MSTAAVAQALALPVPERGAALLALPEDQWFDRKSPRVGARELANVEIAFANAEGGVIIVGLEADTVEGIARRRRSLNTWQQAAMDFTIPPAPATTYLVSCVNEQDEHDQLLVIEVETSELVHRNARDEVYLRVGDETRKLSFRQRQELVYDKGQAFYEATVVRGATLDELDHDLLESYASAVGHPDPVRLLQARGLLTRERGLTTGSVLLFGNDPQTRYPEATVRVLRYRGTERGAGARQQLVADVRCDGPIPRLLGLARDEIYRRIPTRQALGRDGRFGPVGLIPKDAWLEGLVNAVVHRSYSLMGDHIRVEIFDDRVEIESPGRFPGLVDISDPLTITRFARNPRVARVCADLRFGQELGEGIRRIFEEMRLAGLADPDYVQTAGSVRLTLSATAVDRELEARLPPEGRRLIRLIRESERPSTGDLVDAVGLSRPAVLKRLHALEELGLIERVARSAKDPRAYWRLSS
jgi:ATP-dependent DNA helicase RecG